MTSLEMQTAFEIEVGIIDSRLKPISSDIFYWINRAVEKFVKTRYTGNNPKKESFEQSQKRIDDLQALVKEIVLPTYTGFNKPDSFTSILPSDYLYKVGEEVLIFIPTGSTIGKRTGVTEITTDRYFREIENPFSEYKAHYGLAKPLRMFYGGYAEFITDGTYVIGNYFLRYISIPNTVSLTNQCNLASPTHPEIIKIAVSMYIEKNKDSRYQTIENEITHQE
jgi:hypothetical protein